MSQPLDETPVPDSPPSIGWGAIGDVQQKLILDHSRNPRNSRTLANPDIHATEVNPFCGDETTIQAHIIDGVLAEVGIHGVGCSICQASLSMLSEAVLHLTPSEASTLSTNFQRMMQGEPIDAEDTARLGDLAGLISVRNYPIRVKCALLAWVALDQGLQGHLTGV